MRARCAAVGGSFEARRRACGPLRPESSAFSDRRDRVEPRLVELGIGLRALESHAVEPSLHDIAVAQDEDCQPGAIGQLDELEMSVLGPLRTSRGDHRGALRARRQDRRREPQPLVRGQLHLAELVANPEAICLVELRLSHQRLHVQPVAEVRRNAAGGCVRMAEQSERLELSHGATDGGRRDAQAVARDEGLGTDRHRGEDVVLHHGAQHVALSLGELGARPNDVAIAMYGALAHRASAAGQPVSTLGQRVLTRWEGIVPILPDTCQRGGTNATSTSLARSRPAGVRRTASPSTSRRPACRVDATGSG